MQVSRVVETRRPVTFRVGAGTRTVPAIDIGRDAIVRVMVPDVTATRRLIFSVNL